MALTDELRGNEVFHYLEASDALVSLELLAVLEPFESGGGVAAGLAAELDCLARRDSVKFLLHLLRLSPLRRHC